MFFYQFQNKSIAIELQWVMVSPYEKNTFMMQGSKKKNLNTSLLLGQVSLKFYLPCTSLSLFF